MAIFRLAWQTWLFKIGPEQFPASNSFMWFFVGLNIVIGWITIIATGQVGVASLLAAVTGPMLLLLWVRLLGKVNGFPERVVQVTACLMMGACVFDLISLPISIALVPYAELIMQASQDPLLMEDVPSSVIMLSMLTLVLLGWFLVFMVRTLNSGYEKGLFSSVIYTFVYFVFAINVSGALAVLFGAPEMAATGSAT